jgi:hypothetical protein
VREGSPDRTLREEPTSSLRRGRCLFLPIGRPTTLRVIVSASVLALTSATAWTQPAPLDHPTVEQRLEELKISWSDGYRGDQKSLWKKEFPRLLDRVKNLPYFAGVGNHELKPKERFTTSRTARENTAAFLGPSYTLDRLYLSKQIWPVQAEPPARAQPARCRSRSRRSVSASGA